MDIQHFKGGNLCSVFDDLAKKYWEDKDLGYGTYLQWAASNPGMTVNRQEDEVKKLYLCIYPVWLWVHQASMKRGCQKSSANLNAAMAATSVLRLAVALVTPERPKGLGTRTRHKDARANSIDVGRRIQNIESDIVRLATDIRTHSNNGWVPATFMPMLDLASRALKDAFVSFNASVLESKSLTLMQHLAVVFHLGKERGLRAMEALPADLEVQGFRVFEVDTILNKARKINGSTKTWSWATLKRIIGQNQKKRSPFRRP